MIPCPLRLYLSDALRDPRPRNLELASAGDHALGFAVGSPARTRTVTLRSDNSSARRWSGFGERRERVAFAGDDVEAMPGL